ncbi:Rab family GTPase [[Eubacterium] cellulosolvens]
MVDIKRMKKKICLLGDAAVGKTSLIRRYVFDMFDDKYITTLGAKVSRKEIDLQFSKRLDKPIQVNVVLSIWDILGQKNESAARVRPVYYSGANGGLVVCDITRHETFESIPGWIKSFFKVTEEVPIVLLGNKIDLYKQAEIYYEDLEKFAKDYNYPVYITSARTNSNVEQAFIKLTELMLEQSIITE